MNMANPREIINEFARMTGFHYLNSSRPSTKRIYHFQEGNFYISEMKTFIGIQRKMGYYNRR